MIDDLIGSSFPIRTSNSDTFHTLAWSSVNNIGQHSLTKFSPLVWKGSSDLHRKTHRNI